MKHLILSIILALFVIGCTKSNPISNNIQQSPDSLYVTATINGQSFAADSITYFIDQVADGWVAYNGWMGKKNWQNIEFDFTRSLDSVTSWFYTKEDTTVKSGNAGIVYNAIQPVQIEITYHDSKYVAGTFSGDFYSNETPPDTIHITNGSFSLPVH